MFRSQFGDPGPCPVDDAPHTTCTSPGYAGEGVLVTVRRPLVLDCVRATPTPTPEPPAPVTFSTGEYRRELHGPARKRRKKS